jgi:energy-coupling factor transport system substrate-specific component
MRELLEVWRNTRLIVQVAVTAALYAALLIPFKAVAVIIPGVTEIRPANAIPIVCALLFGPAAAWGSAFGNLIGDFFGTLGPGSIFGFIGNFLYAYVPYRVWGVYRLAGKKGDSWVPTTWSLAIFPLLAVGTMLVGLLVAVVLRGLHVIPYFQVSAPAVYAASAALIAVTMALVALTQNRESVEFYLTVGLAALVCAIVISWGAELLSVAPFKILSVAITLNNFVLASVLGPPLLKALYPRVRQWGLLYWQTLEREPAPHSYRVTLGALLCWAGCAAALVIGLGVPAEEATKMVIVTKVAPAIGVVVLGVLLI